jgi:hypothetical protein
LFGAGPPGRARRDATGARGVFREVRSTRPASAVEGRRPRLDGTQRLFLIAFLGSLVFLAWGIVDRSSNQVAVLVAGLLVLALTLASLAVAGAITAYRAAREGKGARAFWAALLGGLIALAAWGCLAAAAVLALLYA